MATRCASTNGLEGVERSNESLERISERLRSALGAEAYDRFFGHDARLALEHGQLVVTVPTTYQANVIRKRFGEHLSRAVLDMRPDAGHDAGWVVEVDRGVAPEPARVERRRVARPSREPAPVAVRRLRLEDFVVGESNRLAHAAARRLAEAGVSPRGEARRSLGFASLFIHGGCGMGKTHLLQGIADRFARLNPSAGVRYTTAEAFTNEYISALREGRVEAFRRAFRRLDLLCLDDVHFVAGKESTQNELLHTLDAIDLDGALVALASDEHPRNVQRLGARLVSRFLSGMVVRIDPPDADLRLRLVVALAERRGLRLEESAARLLAERAGERGSVRDIEGLVVQVEAVCRLLPDRAGQDGRVGLAAVTRALGMSEADRGPATTRPRRPVPIESITDAVCRALRVGAPEFVGRGRHKRVVLARSIAAWLARHLTTASFPEIARAIGRPNHSTIVTACQRLRLQLQQEAADGTSFLARQFGPEFAGTTLRGLVDRLYQDLARGA